MNGLNNGQLQGAMAGFPIPAGHSAELNYIHAMVEELSRQLAENKRQLEEVVSGVGRVRIRARAQQLGNEELISAASDELGIQETNIDALVSHLSEALEKAKYSRDANSALVQQYAEALRAMLAQFHEYKQRHLQDVSAWHRSYRAQLAEARAENGRLREQVWAMQRHAAAANDVLRRFRARLDADADAPVPRWGGPRRADERARRQELRFWKRLAMPDLPDDDPYWSDDDDLVDPAEKIRLRDAERKAALERPIGGAGAGGGVGGGVGGGGGGGDEGEPALARPLLGGVAMEREESAPVPVPPPRPLSAAFSTGSSGQTG